MTNPNKTGIFAGDDPFEIARAWLAEAEQSEPNDPNAMALATVDADGMPNTRMVLLKDIGADCFTFYTNYNSAKSVEILGNGKCAFVMHWKSLRRQVRVRGLATKEDGPEADAYFESRSLQSKLGAWASYQSQPLESRGALIKRVAGVSLAHGLKPKRPPFWGGFRIIPLEIEFWADGKHRLHDRFRWQRAIPDSPWDVSRLNP
ncbi:MAG: pyridoxamine 5'-phosphate oxidase [Rhodobacteraceae bacterium]|nr:pyridoxamine 5'-phosphate oxidase [Paracoccaceae bacterium]